MKRILEKSVKWLLTASGFVTSVVILLIIGFLFTEGAGLFGEPVVEEGYVLALNSENPVSTLTAAEIKAVFDEDVVNWKDLGGKDMAIETFRLEDVDDSGVFGRDRRRVRDHLDQRYRGAAARELHPPQSRTHGEAARL